jgi:DNA-binding PadR family transcriptional regulator
LIAASGRTLGRYLEPALWVLIALDGGPLGLPELLDGVRRLDGPMGHGSLLGSLARLERLRLVESGFTDAGSRVYRLTILGRAADRSAALLKGQSS